MGMFVYTCSRNFLRLAFWLGGGLEVHGLENVPSEGPLIVACSHSSHLDPMILGAAFRRPLHFLARRTLFDIPLFSWLIRQNFAFPLDREGDSRDALRAFGERLEQGNAVVLFPEGTRSSDGVVGDMKPGVGMLAVRNGAPVVPVYIWGSHQSWPRRRRFPRPHHLKAYIGKAVIPAAEKAQRKAELARVTHDVGTRICEMERLAWEGEANPPAALVEKWRRLDECCREEAS